MYATYDPPSGARSPVAEYFPTQYPVKPTWLVREYPAGTSAEFAKVAPRVLIALISDLRVGFDEKRHGYINPCQDLLDDNVPEARDKYGENEDSYKPKKF